MTHSSSQKRSMTLGELTRAVASDATAADGATAGAWQHVVVGGMSLDTRALSAGDLYLALPGHASHGIEHAAAAVAAGAVAVFTMPGAAARAGELDVPVIEVPDLVSRVAALADTFFDSPADALRIVAVTGTDGKTSVCRFVADAFAALGQIAGYVGTIGWGVVGTSEALSNTSLTTPDAVAMRRMLRQMVDAGASTVALEASSHGIAEGRLEGLSIDIAVLTNLGRDHLDYHGTEEAYAASKARLFDVPSLSVMVVNADDRLGQALVEKYVDQWQGTRALGLFSLSESGTPMNADAANVIAQALQVRTTAAGIEFVLQDGGSRLVVNSMLLGRFNVANLLACHAVLRLAGVAPEQSVKALQGLQAVPGRMDRVDTNKPHEPVVIIDYAHTPDALTAALAAARGHCEGDLVVVFGCGGDRDAGKRAPMAQAARAADRIVITDDNPRTESSELIIEQIVSGLNSRDEATVIADRGQAIDTAVSAASSADVVLIAGKGHEDYQIVGTERRPFSDHAVARAALVARASVATATSGECA